MARECRSCGGGGTCSERFGLQGEGGELQLHAQRVAQLVRRLQRRRAVLLQARANSGQSHVHQFSVEGVQGGWCVLS